VTRGGIVGSARRGVEGNDPNWVRVLAFEQIDDHRFQIGGLNVGLSVCPAIPAKIIDDQIKI
jgi:hypothetical protein